MSKATVAKLTVLIFLAFIVCLPEFFPSKVTQVQFLCAPFDPCDPNSGRGYEMYDNGRVPRPRCEAQNSTNQDAAVKQWLLCETHADLQRLHDNASASENPMEVIFTLRYETPPLLQNISVQGHFNHSGLYIKTLPDPVLFSCCVQKNESTRQNKETTPTSSSATPGIFSAGPSEGTSKSSFNHTHQPNRTHCFAHFKDIQGMSSTTGRWSVSTIVWLVLVTMVIVMVLLGVREEVFKNRYCCKKKPKPVRRPAKQPMMFSQRRVKSVGDLPDNVSVLSIEDVELFLERTPSDSSRGHVTHQRKASLVSKKEFLHIFQESSRRGLSPIPELSVTDVSLRESEDGHDEEMRSDDEITDEELEVCLDIPLTPTSTHSENFTVLHHRSLPSLEMYH